MCTSLSTRTFSIGLLAFETRKLPSSFHEAWKADVVTLYQSTEPSLVPMYACPSLAATLRTELFKSPALFFAPSSGITKDTSSSIENGELVVHIHTELYGVAFDCAGNDVVLRLWRREILGIHTYVCTNGPGLCSRTSSQPVGSEELPHTYNLTTIDPTACDRTTVMVTLTLPPLSSSFNNSLCMLFCMTQHDSLHRCHHEQHNG